MKGIPSGVKIPSVKPMNDQILMYLEPDADKFSAAPSLVKPDAAKADHVFRIGRIVRLGPGRTNKRGNRIPINAEVGMRVLFIKFIATHTESAKSVQHRLGKDFALMQEKDLLLWLDDSVKMEDISQ